MQSYIEDIKYVIENCKPTMINDITYTHSNNNRFIIDIGCWNYFYTLMSDYPKIQVNTIVNNLIIEDKNNFYKCNANNGYPTSLIKNIDGSYISCDCSPTLDPFTNNFFVTVSKTNSHKFNEKDIEYIQKKLNYLALLIFVNTPDIVPRKSHKPTGSIPEKSDLIVRFKESIQKIRNEYEARIVILEDTIKSKDHEIQKLNREISTVHEILESNVLTLT